MGPGSALKLGPIYKWDEIKLSGKKFKARLKYNLPKLSIYVSQQRLKKKIIKNFGSAQLSLAWLTKWAG